MAKKATSKQPVDLAKRRAAKRATAKKRPATAAKRSATKATAAAKEPASRSRGRGPRAQVHMEEVDNLIEDRKLEGMLEEEWSAIKRRRKANGEVRELKKRITIALAERDLEEGKKYRCGRFPIRREDIEEEKVEFTQHARTAFNVGDPLDGS